jgi:hypothetical protein
LFGALYFDRIPSKLQTRTISSKFCMKGYVAVSQFNQNQHAIRLTRNIPNYSYIPDAKHCLNTVSFGLLHCINYSQKFQMNCTDTCYAYIELQPIIPQDRKPLTLCSQGELLYMFGTAYSINILKSLPKCQDTILITCWVVAATARQTKTYVCLLSI